jgi:hypothetical protein
MRTGIIAASVETKLKAGAAREINPPRELDLKTE